MSRVDEIRTHSEFRDQARQIVASSPYISVLTLSMFAIDLAERALIAEARVEKLEGLLRQMKPTSRMCWCEPSRDIERFGHMVKCEEARTLLADESEENEQ
jgi:hypothetical protein